MPRPAPVYLDHNATTPVHPEVRGAMARALEEGFGNPSSHHWAGRLARGMVDRAREEIARAIGGSVAEIVFTSGASEADNLAIRGTCREAIGPRDTIVLTAVEHPAVRAAALSCADRGWRVVTVGVDAEGRLDLDALDRALDGRAFLVAAMAVNNETGVVLPVAEIGRLARARGVLFFCDAVQAPGKIPVDVGGWGADLVAFTAHKLGGPKGIGCLWARRGLELAPLIVGGSQERERRAGTENVPGIVGFGAAMRIACASQAENAGRVRRHRDRLEAELTRRIPGAVVHGARAERVTNTAYLSFPGALGENLLIALDLEGIAVSGGSACASGAMHPSHTLEAMGVPAAMAMGAVRFSLGPATTEAEIDRVLEVVPRLVEEQRAHLGQGPRA